MEEPTHVSAPQLDQLATALAAAQAKFPAAPKTGKNPFLKNEYATLDDIIGAVRGPLGAHGLSFVQLLGSNGEGMTLRTILLHKSGQMLDSVVTIGASGPEKGINALQSAGKAITYMKRYTLGAMLGVATDGDTDGNGADKATKKQPQRKPAPKKAPTPAPDKATPADTLDDTPTISNPPGLIAALPEYYKGSGKRALNTLNKVNGTDLKTWPLDDPKFYPDALETLTNYASEQRAQEAQAVVSETAEQMKAPF